MWGIPIVRYCNHCGLLFGMERAGMFKHMTNASLLQSFNLSLLIVPLCCRQAAPPNQVPLLKMSGPMATPWTGKKQKQKKCRCSSPPRVALHLSFLQKHSTTEFSHAPCRLQQLHAEYCITVFHQWWPFAELRPDEVSRLVVLMQWSTRMLADSQTKWTSHRDWHVVFCIAV